MPAYTRNVLRDKLTFVHLNALLLYGFKTKDLSAIAGVTAANLTALGHLDNAAATALVGLIRVFGCNSPQPYRVTKRLTGATVNTQASISTFCAYDKLAAAAAIGFNMSKARKGVKLTPNSGSRRSVTAIAQLSNAINFAFSMNTADFTAHKVILGLKQSSEITTTAEKNGLITASPSTYPGKAQLVLPAGGTIQTYFTTSQASALATAGWDILSEEILYDPA